MNDYISYLKADRERDLQHYGVKRRSGRYPWGSGRRPFQGETRKQYVERRRSFYEKDRKVARTVGKGVKVALTGAQAWNLVTGILNTVAVTGINPMLAIPIGAMSLTGVVIPQIGKKSIDAVLDDIGHWNLDEMAESDYDLYKGRHN